MKVEFLEELKNAEYGIRVNSHNRDPINHSEEPFIRPVDYQFTEPEIFALKPYIQEHTINDIPFKSYSPHHNKSLLRRFESELLKAGTEAYKQGEYLDFLNYLKEQTYVIIVKRYKLIDNAGTQFRDFEGVFSKFLIAEYEDGHKESHQNSLYEISDWEALHKTEIELKDHLVSFIKDGINQIRSMIPPSSIIGHHSYSNSSKKGSNNSDVITPTSYSGPKSYIPKIGSLKKYVEGGETFLNDLHKMLIDKNFIEPMDVTVFRSCFRNLDGKIHLVKTAKDPNSLKSLTTEMQRRTIVSLFPKPFKEAYTETRLNGIFSNILGYESKKSFTSRKKLTPDHEDYHTLDIWMRNHEQNLEFINKIPK